MNIALNGRPLTAVTQQPVAALLQEIDRRRIGVWLSEGFAENLNEWNVPNPFTNTYNRDLPEADFVFSIGGDGTLLETITQVGRRQLPIVGINTGRLGFLATVNPVDFKEALDLLESGRFTTQERVLLHVENTQDVFGGVNFGLNDFCITKTDRSSMILVHSWLDGEFLNSYWADGLVISTPTGSTGYSLSVGGPVVLPQTANFIISPISPHNLNVRPMVVRDMCRIELRVESRSRNCLVSLDSRSKVIDDTVQFCVRKEDFGVRLVNFPGATFIETLRTKLNWGLDVRN